MTLETGDMIVPDKIFPEIGYRGWSYDSPTGKLRSLTQSQFFWQPGEPMVARCSYGGGNHKPVVSVAWRQVPEDGDGIIGGVYIAAADAFAVMPDEQPDDGMRWDPLVVETSTSVPNEGCACGVYSLSNPNWSRIMGYHSGPGPLVLGRVKLWGKIIPGQLGRKSQYAYPETLWVITTLGFTLTDAQRIATKLSELYGCPAHVAEIDHINGRIVVRDLNSGVSVGMEDDGRF